MKRQQKIRKQILPNDIYKNWKVIYELPRRLSGTQYRRYFLCECLLCNSTYELSYSALTAKNKSQSCASCAYSKDLTGNRYGKLIVLKKDKLNKNGGWEYICKCDCGKTKNVRGSKLQNGYTQSCGCYRLEQIKTKCRGENHHNWKGGVTTQQHKERIEIQKKFSKALKKEYNSTCQKCNKKTRSLHIHHIFDKQHHKNLKFTYSNLILLCKNCHKNFHTIYGYKTKSTLNNLEEFIGREYKFHNELLAEYKKWY